MALLWFCTTANAVNNIASLDELSLEFSPQVEDAINNGVSLTINCQFADLKSLLIFDFPRNKKMHHFTLKRHALSNRYIVKRDDLSTPHMFRSISEANNYITTQAVILLENYTTFDPNRKMRLSLNKFELPGPMRLQAFIFDVWDLDTGWLSWDFAS